MATKLIIIVGVSVAVVVFMFILGKLADGKDDKKESEEKWRGGRMVLCLGAVADLRAVAAFFNYVLGHPVLAFGGLHARRPFRIGLVERRGR